MSGMKDRIHIPIDTRALEVLRAIEAAQESAWFVGGCVRDAFLGKRAQDFDIATSASWQTVAAIAAKHGWRVIDTGAAHGSIAVAVDGMLVETTTYRVESGYSDARRPDSVTFVDAIEADLARRDFRMNALAYHPERGILDLHGGRKDIAKGIVSTVGAPEERFGEDPLRIMRALRFCAQLGFQMDHATESALFACADGLGRIAVERVFAELSKLLLAPCAGRVIARYASVVAHACPELFSRSAAPSPDAWNSGAFERIARVLDAAPADRTVRFAALFCGIDAEEERRQANAGCKTTPAAEAARAALTSLKAPRRLTEDVCALVANRNAARPVQRETMLLLAARLGGDTAFMRRLCALQDAEDNADGITLPVARTEFFDRLVCAGEPLSRRDLAISGKDLVACGMQPGPAIATALDALLHEVVYGRIANDENELIAAIPSSAFSPACLPD
ncbi:MAG: hypothetical protein Q4B69_01980 [Slackia sp.]|nr:hypothetical protein [Slackia sp.]